jgi:hypothetical protein
MSADIKHPPWEEATTSPTLASFLPEIQILDSGVEKVELDLISLGPWSYSKYKSLKKCPFQYYLKYVLKFKVPPNLQLESDPVSANVGKAAHQILEDILTGKTVEKAFAKSHKEYVGGTLLSEENWQEKVMPLHYNISRFKERIEGFELRNPVKRILTELRMAVNRDFEPTGFFSKDAWLRGVIDLVLVLECLDAVIFDHKTGGGQGSVKNYEEQLDWYKILFHFGIQKVAGAQTGVHFIGEGEVKMAQYSPASEIENNLKNSLEMSLEGAIDMLRDKGYFKHVRGGYCKWCEYDNIGCKSGEFKPLELSTKRFFTIKPI